MNWKCVFCLFITVSVVGATKSCPQRKGKGWWRQLCKSLLDAGDSVCPTLTNRKCRPALVKEAHCTRSDDCDCPKVCCVTNECKRSCVSPKSLVQGRSSTDNSKTPEEPIEPVKPKDSEEENKEVKSKKTKSLPIGKLLSESGKDDEEEEEEGEEEDEEPELSKGKVPKKEVEPSGKKMPQATEKLETSKSKATEKEAEPSGKTMPQAKEELETSKSKSTEKEAEPSDKTMPQAKEELETSKSKATEKEAEPSGKTIPQAKEELETSKSKATEKEAEPSGKTIPQATEELEPSKSKAPKKEEEPSGKTMPKATERPAMAITDNKTTYSLGLDSKTTISSLPDGETPTPGSLKTTVQPKGFKTQKLEAETVKQDGGTEKLEAGNVKQAAATEKLNVEDAGVSKSEKPNVSRLGVTTLKPSGGSAASSTTRSMPLLTTVSPSNPTTISPLIRDKSEAAIMNPRFTTPKPKGSAVKSDTTTGTTGKPKTTTTDKPGTTTTDKPGASNTGDATKKKLELSAIKSPKSSYNSDQIDVEPRTTTPKPTPPPDDIIRNREVIVQLMSVLPKLLRSFYRGRTVPPLVVKLTSGEYMYVPPLPGYDSNKRKIGQAAKMFNPKKKMFRQPWHKYMKNTSPFGEESPGPHLFPIFMTLTHPGDVLNRLPDQTLPAIEEFFFRMYPPIFKPKAENGFVLIGPLSEERASESKQRS